MALVTELKDGVRDPLFSPCSFALNSRLGRPMTKPVWWRQAIIANPCTRAAVLLESSEQQP